MLLPHEWQVKVNSRHACNAMHMRVRNAHDMEGNAPRLDNLWLMWPALIQHAWIAPMAFMVLPDGSDACNPWGVVHRLLIAEF